MMSRAFRLTFATRSPPPRSWFVFLFFCFLWIVGIRAFFINKYGASLAFVDEWEATGQRILAAWHDGTLSLAALFQAHNGDHRIVVSRLWEIFWFTLNGSWDPILVMTAKIGVYAAAAVVFTHILAGGLQTGRRYCAGALLAVLFAFPFGYHNLIWAFQSQFDFFLLACALGWLAVISDRPLLGCGIAAAALFTLGAGPVLAVSFVPFWWLNACATKWTHGKAIRFTALSAIIAAFGLLLRTGDAAALGALPMQIKAFSALVAWPYSNFTSVLERLPEAEHLVPIALLNFPAPNESWLRLLAGWIDQYPLSVLILNGVLGIALFAPLISVICGIIAARKVSPDSIGPLCIGAFALVAFIATAIARADLTTTPARYLDVVVLGGFAALCSCFVLIQSHARWRPYIYGWGIAFGSVYAVTMFITIGLLERNWPRSCLPNVQQYAETHDRTLFPDNNSFALPILDTDPTAFLDLLDDPRMQAVLPLSVTAPDHPLAWPAYLAQLVGKLGLTIAGFAAIGAIVTVFRAVYPQHGRGRPISAPEIRPLRLAAPNLKGIGVSLTKTVMHNRSMP